MSTFLALTVVGVVSGCIYALTAAGLVVTYTTSGIFNFAHGAVGMIAAFAYWQLKVHEGWPTPLAIFVVVFVGAPLAGAVIERVLMRRLEGAPLQATLTVTVGLLLFLIGLANVFWKPTVARSSPQFFNGHEVTVGGVVLTWHQLIVVIVAVLVAVGLRLFLFGTRPGVATRAVVDNPELTALTGATPMRFAQLGWALGAMLAAVAGVLLAPLVTLDINTLTLLVINGYAAAMVGRLRNLPWTFAGGVFLGLLESYAVGYLPVGNVVSQIQPIVPMVFLFLVLLVVPQNRLRVVAGIRSMSVRVAGFRESVGTSAGFVVVAWIVSLFLSDANLATATRGVALGIIMLSLVLLSGYGGQMSLCQLTFAGLGAFAMSKVGGASGRFVGVLAAVGLSAAVGALVALPALRLRGLYLALATLAFAYSMDYAFFQNQHAFGDSLSLAVGRIHFFGIPYKSNEAYFIFTCVVFALVAIGLLALRRASLGRRLVAMGDSPAACATMGMSLTRTKLVVFTLSAGLAGLGGAIYGGSQGLVGPDDFALLSSLTLLLLAVVWGIRTTGGMLFAGVTLAIGPVVQTHIHSIPDLLSLFVGLAAIGVSQNPEGTFGNRTPAQAWRNRQARERAAAAAAAAGVGGAAATEELSHVAG